MVTIFCQRFLFEVLSLYMILIFHSIQSLVVNQAIWRNFESCENKPPLLLLFGTIRILKLKRIIFSATI